MMRRRCWSRHAAVRFYAAVPTLFELGGMDRRENVVLCVVMVRSFKDERARRLRDEVGDKDVSFMNDERKRASSSKPPKPR